VSVDPRPDDVDTLLVEPDIELVGLESHEAADLDEWDPALGDQPTDMARRDAENLGDFVRVE
jgi:hypothetical protein